jgi:hypothetical protein
MADDNDPESGPTPSEPKALLLRIHERYDDMQRADQMNRRNSLADLRFLHIPGEQWEWRLRTLRGLERPMYEFNKLRVTVKRVVNEIRANRPQGKVRAVEDNDADTAEVMEGLCRNIWAVSDGDTVIDNAAEFAVGGGMGAWRINTKYSTDEAFDQDIVIESIKNPFTLYADPGCQDPLKRDAFDWILTTKMSHKAYENRWPNAKKVDFEYADFDHLEDDWADEESVRVCEYWWKEPQERTIVMLSNGITCYEEEFTAHAQAAAQQPLDPTQPPPPPLTIIRKRQVRTNKIRTVICSGDAILEGPSDWAGSQFPFIICYGEWIVIDGRTYWFGLTRFAKDAQRNYNYVRTAITETIAQAPQSKFWATPVQAEGHTEKWAEAHSKLFPFQLYNPDPQAPGPPARMGGADVPVAMIQETQMASEEIKAVTGIFDPSLGRQSNETSGVAIRSRQAQGEIATFNYADNVSKAIRRTWEILIDLIPKVYDTERSVRILGSDGAEKYLRVNQVGPDGQVINDLSRGRYDVTVTVGPSYSTMRQEAAEVYTQLGQTNPLVWQTAGDLIFKSFDLPYAHEIAERLRATLPPPIQQMLQEEGGKPIPPEVMQKLQQADVMMQQVQQHGQLVQAAAQEAMKEKADAEKVKSEVQGLLADLEVKKAQFEADVAKSLAAIATREAAAEVKEAKVGTSNDRQSLGLEVQDAVSQINALAATFMQNAAQTIAEIQTRSQPHVVVANLPRSKTVRVRRVNGELVGQIEETPQVPGEGVPSQPMPPTQGPPQ